MYNDVYIRELRETVWRESSSWNELARSSPASDAVDENSKKPEAKTSSAKQK
jgi:hypothetical protein